MSDPNDDLHREKAVPLSTALMIAQQQRWQEQRNMNSDRVLLIQSNQTIHPLVFQEETNGPPSSLQPQLPHNGLGPQTARQYNPLSVPGTDPTPW